MIIGLLSFAIDTSRPASTQAHTDVVLEVLRSRPDVDLLVASGWTLWDEAELRHVLVNNPNDRTVAIVETWAAPRGGLEHRGFAVRGKHVLVEGTPQVFATSAQLNGHPELASQLLDEIESRRCISVDGRVVTWLMCGEINLLANVQSEANRCRFRFDQHPELYARWNRILEGTDIFVNPTHTVMGNQGKLAKRRGHLSASGRIFCSASNVDLARQSRASSYSRLGQVPVQYFWRDGLPIATEEVEHTDASILRVWAV